MLSYYNVHVTKNRGKYSRFPEHYWVASSLIYAFHPTMFFQLGECPMKSFSTFLAPVVQNLDSTIHRINLYPVDNAIGFPNTYPLVSDLSSG